MIRGIFNLSLGHFPLWAAISPNQFLSISEAQDRLVASSTQERHITHKLRVQRGLERSLTLFQDPQAQPSLLHLVTFWKDEPSKLSSLLNVMGLKNLQASLVVAILEKTIEAEPPAIAFSETISAFIKGGSARERLLAHHEGREYVEPAPEPIPDIPIVTELQFVPQRHPEFDPVKVTLQRQGKDCPLIIERLTYEQASRLLDTDPLYEFDLHIELSDLWNPTLQILMIRTFDGHAEGVSISSLETDKDRTWMKWKYATKFDRNPETAIQRFGPALLLLLLQQMRDANLWHKTGPVIDYFLPEVLKNYRKQFPPFTPPPGKTLSPDSIDRAEAEHLLAHNPFFFEKITQLI